MPLEMRDGLHQVDDEVDIHVLRQELVQIVDVMVVVLSNPTSIVMKTVPSVIMLSQAISLVRPIVPSDEMPSSRISMETTMSLSEPAQCTITPNDQVTWQYDGYLSHSIRLV